MIEYSGAPFQYNPAVTNVNIDNQLAGILLQFNDDYIMDIVKDSISNRFRIYDLPRPNVVNAFEITFKNLTDGFTSNTDEILGTRRRVYANIIDIICGFYDFSFNDYDEMDYYSAAFWLYDFFISNFTNSLINFYTLYLIKEKDSIDSSLGLSQLKKDNDTTLLYSRKLFKDSKLANIHCNLEYVIDQISTFDISLQMILETVYSSNPNVASYISSIVSDTTGNFFKKHYQSFIYGKEAADILIQIKLNLQQLGGQIEPLEV